jgi:hypothetical protein
VRDKADSPPPAESSTPHADAAEPSERSDEPSETSIDESGARKASTSTLTGLGSVKDENKDGGS